MTQLISIKDTRNKLAEIIDTVSLREDVFIITKFGKPRAMIVPISKNKIDASGIEKSFGAWVKRDDIKNTNKWAANLRVEMNTRK